MLILIAGDFFIKPSVLKGYVEKELSKIKELEPLQFRLLDWKFFREGEVSYTGAIQPIGVREAAGSPEDLMKEVRGSKPGVLIVHGAPVTKEVMEAAEGLRVIGCTRGGPVNVDVKAATERGIPVLFTPGRNADAVADFTMGLILAQLRNIARAHDDLKNGFWNLAYNRYESLGFELKNRVLGIIGLGHIGSKVAERAKGFGMRVIAYDPYVSEKNALRMGVRLVSLKSLLRRSDIVSLHCRLTKETIRLIDEKAISLMKPTAILVNTSRGGVVDTEALYKALSEGRIAGAALDVYETEPLGKDSPLLRLQNVTLTSHIAGYSKDVVHRCGRMIASDLRRFFTGKKPRYIYNPEVLGEKGQKDRRL
ncbi:MAG: 2-hydroxyacid dehydrogenase [Candidatus Bathyarchaeia archaeon]